MAKIKIKGCLRCSKSKGCYIKKTFRNISKEFDSYTETKEEWPIGNFYTVKRLNEFELYCPFVDRFYHAWDKVDVTIGIKRYNKITEWECNRDCDECLNDNCEDGVIKFNNIRYGKYIKAKGEIVNLYKNDKWVINISTSEWDRIKPELNKQDIEFFEKIDSVFNQFSDFDFLIVSKEKYIKRI